MSARKTTASNAVDQIEVVENDTDLQLEVPTTAAEEANETTEDPTIEIAVTLSNGAELTINVIKDQNDWAYEAVEAMSQMNYPVLINAIITRVSKLKLKMAGAKVRDFEMITEKVTGALNSIKAEHYAKKK